MLLKWLILLHLYFLWHKILVRHLWTSLSTIELNIIIEPTGVNQQKMCLYPRKITLGAATVTTNSASFSPPLKQLRDLSRSLRIYVLMA